VDTYLVEQQMYFNYKIKFFVCQFPPHHGYSEVDGLIGECRPKLTRALFDGTLGLETPFDYARLLNTCSIPRHKAYALPDVRPPAPEREASPVSGIQNFLVISYELEDLQKNKVILPSVFKGALNIKEPYQKLFNTKKGRWCKNCSQIYLFPVRKGDHDCRTAESKTTVRPRWPDTPKPTDEDVKIFFKNFQETLQGDQETKNLSESDRYIIPDSLITSLLPSTCQAQVRLL
jgi:hypothetical protein